MMAKIPRLSKNELVPLMELRRSFPIEFYSNKTDYFNSEHKRYVKEGRVWRISIMGETRGGKSEVASTIAFRHVNFFNYFFDKGMFNTHAMAQEHLKINKISFGLTYVCDNQQVYKDRMKEEYNKKRLSWGQVWQIDEEKKSLGGLGSMSDLLETQNLNNITAKFCQSEIWVQPLRFETRNCPYGLKVVKKDIENRVNWCLLFKIEQTPSGSTEFKFLGWVSIPLHKNESFRKKYNALKDVWIDKELTGRLDERENKRMDACKILLKNYRKYFELRDNGKFKYGKAQLVSLVGLLSSRGVFDTVFNEGERWDIVERCRLLVEDYDGLGL